MFHTHRSTMCDLKKLTSGFFPESWKVLAERWQRRRRRRRKKTENNESPGYSGSLKIHWKESHCAISWSFVHVPFDIWMGTRGFYSALFILNSEVRIPINHVLRLQWCLLYALDPIFCYIHIYIYIIYISVYDRLYIYMHLSREILHIVI